MMNAGEYVGKDGRTYRWERAPDGRYGLHDVEYASMCTWHMADDWPAAKAALDELIEAEAGEWVDLGNRLRVSPDGGRGQYRYGKGDDWHEAAFLEWRIRWGPYRKGREVALAQVQELLGPECGSCHARAKYDPELSHRCCIECPIQAVLALAKAVKS